MSGSQDGATPAASLPSGSNGVSLNAKAGLDPVAGVSSGHEDAAAFSVYSDLVPPSIAKLIEREGGVEEWLVEMQVGKEPPCCAWSRAWAATGVPAA